MSLFGPGPGLFGPGGGGGSSPPSAPGLSLVSIASGSVTLRYVAATAETAGEIDYYVGATLTTIVTAGTGNYTASGLVNGTLYTFTARAQTSGAWSGPSAPVSATPAAIPATTPTPPPQAVLKILRTPGRFVIAPTSGTGAFPYGGTYMGYHRAAFLAPILQTMDVFAMEWSRRSAKLFTRDDTRLVAILRGYDPNAVGLFFPNPGTGGGGEAKASAKFRAGYYVTECPLLFAPFDSTAPGVYFPHALPSIEEAARVNLALDQDAETAVVFDAGGTSASGTAPWQIGLVSEMTIP